MMNETLQASPNCFELIRHFESLHDGDLKKLGLQPKLCPAGVWTIGWGHVVIDPKNGERLEGPMGKLRALELFPSLNVVDAQVMLEQDVEIREKRVRRFATVQLAQHEFDALVSFEFNTGGLRHSTLLMRLNCQNREGAARQFDVWNKCAGKILPGLTRRRAAERLLFTTGQLNLK